MIYAAPAHVGNVKKTVQTTQVDKGAEVGYVLYHTLTNVAFAYLRQELLFLLLPLLLQKPPARNDYVLSGLVYLEYLTGHFLPYIRGYVSGRLYIYLRGGQEDRYAKVDQESTFYLSGNCAGHHVALVIFCDNLFPASYAVGLPL